MLQKFLRRWHRVPLALQMYAALLMLMGAGGTGWFGVQSYRHEAAIHEIERIGGEVSRMPGGPTWLPGWARGGWIGRPFERVQLVGLDTTSITDRGLESLTILSGIDTLHLANTRITDAGLANVVGLDRLETLDLGRTQITDAGLVHLQALTNLRVLGLYHTRITDAGLAELHRLKKLQYLNLDETRVTDAGLAHLAKIASLKSVTLDGTRVSDEGIAVLRRALPGVDVSK